MCSWRGKDCAVRTRAACAERLWPGLVHALLMAEELQGRCRAAMTCLLMKCPSHWPSSSMNMRGSWHASVEESKDLHNTPRHERLPATALTGIQKSKQLGDRVRQTRCTSACTHNLPACWSNMHIASKLDMAMALRRLVSTCRVHAGILPKHLSNHGSCQFILQPQPARGLNRLAPSRNIAELVPRIFQRERERAGEGEGGRESVQSPCHQCPFAWPHHGP